MNFGTHPKEFSDAVNFCEKALSSNQFINGNRLTSLDKDYFEKLQSHDKMLSPLTHPHTFSWYSFVFKFGDQVRASWPSVE